MSFRASVLMCAILAAPQAQSAPLADVLQRPALPAAQPAKATLLGAAQGGDRLVAVGERGIVVLSDDAGKTWQQAKVPVSVTLTAVRMVDDRRGFAVGHGGVVLATDDGGQSWRKLVDGIALAQVALKAAQDSGDAAVLKEAQRLVADGADKPLLDLHFFDASHGLVIGAYNLAFETKDGGRTWQSIARRFDNPQALHLYALRARGDTLVVAGEQGLVFLSDDRGRSFRRLNTPYKGSFFTAELAGGREIFVAGLRGNAWRSVDRGASWSQVEVPAPVAFTASAQRDGQGVVLANQAGTLFSWRDGRWVVRPGAAAAPVTGVLALADGRLLVLGRQGPALIAAGGASSGAKP